MDFSAILFALVKLFLLMLLGFVLNRTHLLDSKANKGISALLINATNPALVIGSMASTGELSRGTVLTLILFGCGLYILMPLLAFVLVRILKIDITKRGTAQLLLIFGNTGFMAIPVLQSLYGDICIFVTTLLNLPFNFLIYSYGVYLIEQDVRKAKEKAACINAGASAVDLAGEGTGTAENGVSDKPSKNSDFSWKLFLSPGIMASALALILFFLGIQLPTKVNEVLMYLGNCTPPLSMLLLGSLLAEYPLKGIFADPKINIMLMIKLFVMPTVILLIAKLVLTDSALIGMTTLTFAMPCGTMCAILSKNKDGDTLTSSAGVVFSTLASLTTIPIVYLLLGPFF